MSLAVLSCLTGEKGSEAWEWQDSLASRYVHLGCTKFSTDLWVSEFENQNTNRGEFVTVLRYRKFLKWTSEFKKTDRYLKNHHIFLVLPE